MREKEGMIEIVKDKEHKNPPPSKKNEKNTLTDLQVHNRIKEISNIEEPLKIEKELKKLSKECDFTIQALKKQLNYLLKQNKKNIQIVGDTHDTNDTDDTCDTFDTNEELKACVSFVSLYHKYITVIFNETVLEQIIKEILIEKRPLTFGELALKTQKSEVHIRNTISKNKPYFTVLKKTPKTSVTLVTHHCLNELESRIENIKKVEEEKKENEAKFRAEQLKKQKYSLEIEGFIQSNELRREGNSLILDYNNILGYSTSLLDYFLDKPQEFIDIVKKKFESKFWVKVVNLPKNLKEDIEKLRKEHLDKIFSIEGRVTSMGEVRPVISKIFFKCPSCGTLLNKEQNYRTGLLEEPKKCSCGRIGGFHLESREELNSCFVQLEDLQDNTDNPHSQRVKGVLFDGLCEHEVIKKFTPGNEVKVTGILKEVPIFKSGRRSTFLNWIFEINDVELIEKDIDVKTFTEEEVEKIEEIANKVDSEGIEVLDDSFAPEVYGYSEIKQALMLQLSNRRNDCKNKSTRNKSNILLIGDPGIAKTVLCKYAVKVSTGAREAVGGGSSAVGITASVVKEEDSMGGYRVEPGAMILAKDILFIDELNNLNEEDKPKLQEGMSEQRVSINKANLHVQMKVTCGILSVANPIYGHFKEDAKESLADQFNIPSPILNRFDTVFMMRDEVDGDNDKRIAEKMMQRHTGNLKSLYSYEELKKYFAYVRYSDEPIINKKVAEIMKEVYSKARKTFNSGVKINPRFFESLTRMSCASAKMRLSNEVLIKDIQVALKILCKSQYNLNELLILEVEKINSKIKED